MAGLHRTIYGYGLVGAQVSGAQRDQTRVFLQQLRSSRDELQPLILTLTQDLAAAAAGYEPDSGVPQTAQEASALAHDMIQEFIAELEAQTAPVQTWVDSQEPSPIKQEVTQALSDLKKSATKQLEYWQQAP